jgi:hypothetical protein
MSKNVNFRWGQKTGKKTAILSLFFETHKNSHFWPFFVCCRVLTISWCVDSKFWWWDDVTMCWWWCRWRKKLYEGPKMTKKWPSSRTLKTCQKWSPARAARNRGAEGRKERLWRDRVRHNLPDARIFTPPRNGTSSASVAMCEAFLIRHAQHTHMSDLPRTCGTHESRHVRAQRSACGYHKSPWGFFWYEVSWRHTG